MTDTERRTIWLSIAAFEEIEAALLPEERFSLSGEPRGLVFWLPRSGGMLILAPKSEGTA